jgi:hypothetical protein
MKIAISLAALAIVGCTKTSTTRATFDEKDQIYAASIGDIVFADQQREKRLPDHSRCTEHRDPHLAPACLSSWK